MSTRSAITRRYRSETLSAYRSPVERVIDFICDRYAESISLKELSSVACMSREHFCRVFSNVTGVTPFRYLGAVRVRAAKRLLLSSDRRVTEICFDVGYSSLGTFVHKFKLAVGRSPNQFRAFAAWLESNIDQVNLSAGHRVLDPAPLGWIRSVHDHRVDFERKMGCGGRVIVCQSTDPIATSRDSSVSLFGGHLDFEFRPVLNQSCCVTALVIPNTLGCLLEGSFSSTSGVLRLTALRPATAPIRFELRPFRKTDPPVVLCLASLLWRVDASSMRPSGLVRGAVRKPSLLKTPLQPMMDLP